MAEIQISLDLFSKPRVMSFTMFLTTWIYKAEKISEQVQWMCNHFSQRNQLREGLIFGSSGKEKSQLRGCPGRQLARASHFLRHAPSSRQLGGWTHECWHPAPANYLFVCLLDNSFFGELSCRPEERRFYAFSPVMKQSGGACLELLSFFFFFFKKERESCQIVRLLKEWSEMFMR